MATNLALDDKLIEEAQRAGKHRTKKEAVTLPCQEYVKRRKQVQILDAFGTFAFDPTYNYKAPTAQTAFMTVLVGTPIWSLALRHKPADLNPREQALTKALGDLIREGRAQNRGRRAPGAAVRRARRPAI